MKSAVVVHPNFDTVWPFAANHLHRMWSSQGDTQLIRLLTGGEEKLGEVVPSPAEIARLAVLGVDITRDCLGAFTSLKEAAICTDGYNEELEPEIRDAWERAGVQIYKHPSEGFWGQSVSEFGLALTLCGLRRIPQSHHAIISSLAPWDYNPPGNMGMPETRGHQFGDDPNFTNGTVFGKKVRIVGAGNIASRYASFVSMLGAEAAAWDPFASEPSFHRAGARKVWHLDELVKDADIFVPMVPLTANTQGIINADHIRALPKGCLVVLATRALICDMAAVRERVLADEISLAADVFDIEPLPLDDPLLGRHNVVHTPHNAGRTIHANEQWAEMLMAQFRPVHSIKTS